jgi:hypothetical protein
MSERGQTGEKKKRFLSREQQAVWKRGQRDAMRGKSKEEKLANREKSKSQLAAMSESERAKLTKDLQAKWDALPESEKKAMQLKMKERKGGGGGKKKRGKGGGDDDD